MGVTISSGSGGRTVRRIRAIAARIAFAGITGCSQAVGPDGPLDGFVAEDAAVDRPPLPGAEPTVANLLVGGGMTCVFRLT